MSYILDALKKIEHEKNKKNRPHGVNISSELFQELVQPASKLRMWKITSLVVLASLLTCTATWYVLRGYASKSSEPVRSIPAPSPAPVTPPAEQLDIPLPAQPISPLAAPSAALPVVPGSSAEAGDDDSSDRNNRRTQKQKMVQPHSSNQPAQATQAPADIKLSGIAWQDEHSARRAVVNGFLLKEGSVVLGAKIIDIRADRVRFLSSVGQFELKLDAVLPAGGQR